MAKVNFSCLSLFVCKRRKQGVLMSSLKPSTCPNAHVHRFTRRTFWWLSPYASPTSLNSRRSAKATTAEYPRRRRATVLPSRVWWWPVRSSWRLNWWCWWRGVTYGTRNAPQSRSTQCRQLSHSTWGRVRRAPHPLPTSRTEPSGCVDFTAVATTTTTSPPFIHVIASSVFCISGF